MSWKYRLTGFSLYNFRIFENKTTFAVAPITILTGTNSSGKSSLTKALNLLKRSYQSSGLQELDLMQSELKLGGFGDIVNNKRDKKEVSFELKIQEVDLEEAPVNIYSICLDYEDWGLKSFRLLSNAEEIFYFEKEESAIYINWPVNPVIKSYIKLPTSIINKEKIKDVFNNYSDIEIDKMCSYILAFIERSTDCHNCKSQSYQWWLEDGDFDILEYAHSFLTDGLGAMGEIEIRDTQEVNENTGDVIDYTINVNISSNPLIKDIIKFVDFPLPMINISKLYLAPFLNLDTIKSLNPFPVDLLKEILKEFQFIGGVRATQEIIYTKENNPELFELLSKCLNYQELGWKVSWLLSKTFGLLETEFDEFEPEYLLNIKKIEGVGYLIKLGEHGIDMSLSSLGYGITQLLPILIKTSLSNDSTFVIEEPESNLHPSLQSKLANFFVESGKKLIPLGQNKFIIETHSEYLIRKLQYLVATGKIRKEEIQIYYFNPPYLENENQIVDIKINEDGSLTDNFGPGFFDEATTWKFELLNLKNSQKN